MNLRTEVAAIVAGTVILAGGVALELAGKVAPPELWVAGTAAITGGVGLALPGSSSSALVGELERLAGYLGSKAPPSTTAPEPAPAATPHPAALSGDATSSPSVSADPAPASSSSIAKVSLP